MGRQIWMKKRVFENWGHIKQIFSLPFPEWAWERRQNMEDINRGGKKTNFVKVNFLKLANV